MSYAAEIARSNKRTIAVIEAEFYSPAPAIADLDYSVTEALIAAATDDEDYFTSVLPAAVVVNGPVPGAPVPPSQRGWTQVNYPPLSASDIGEAARDVLLMPSYPLDDLVWDDNTPAAFIGQAPDGSPASLAIEIRYTPGGVPQFVDAYIPLLSGFGARHVGARVEVWTESGFDWGALFSGGKVAGGLWGGGRMATGLRPPWQQDGVTVRNIWGVGSQGINTRLYAYNLNRPLAEGIRTGTVPDRWAEGQWQVVEYEGLINRPGYADGLARYWIDGECLGEISNAIWTLNTQWLWRGIIISDSWQDGAVSQTQSRWIRNLSVFTP